MNPSLREYSDSIYIAKGIAIILVVIGHYQPLHIPHYWHWLHDFIYSFHMPIFMLLSGFLFAAGKPINSISQYKNLIKNKFKRLIIPFLFIAIIIFILNSIAELRYKLILPISYKTFIDLFINPIESYASILWFLYVLYEIFIIIPLIYYIINNDFYALLLLIFLSFLPWVDIFMIGKLLFYLPIFGLGFLVYNHSILRSDSYKLGLFSLLAFVLLIAFKDYFREPDIIRRIYHLAVGGLGSIAAFFIAIRISRKKNHFSRSLRHVGIYSMGIYLLHTPIMSTLRLCAAEICGSRQWFLPVALIMVAVGIYVPMLVEGHLLRRSALAAKLILGIKLKKV